MMMTLLSEAGFLGCEGIEAGVGAWIVGVIFMGIGFAASFCKDMAKTDIGENICSILVWITLPAAIICDIVGIICMIKM